MIADIPAAHYFVSAKSLVEIEATLPVNAEHLFKQPPFGEKISFTPSPESLKKSTYQQLGLKPRVIYAQDDYQGNKKFTDGISVQETDVVIFLVGPSYAGIPVSQWRQDVIDILGPHLPIDTVLVVPEFKNYTWSDVPNAPESTQVEWEHQWLERADIIAINLSLHWKTPDGSPGNIGPTTRLETGYYFGKTDEKTLVVFVPTNPKPDSMAWIRFHTQDLEIPVYESYPEFYQVILSMAHERPAQL